MTQSDSAKEESDVGVEAIIHIFTMLNVDLDWSQTLKRGFEWWGSRLRQRIWVTPGYDDRGIIIYRVFIVCDCVRGIRKTQNEVDSLLAPLAALSIGSAMVLDPNDNSLRCWTTATIHAGNSAWMTPLLCSLAIIQLIEADSRAEVIAELAGGVIDTSSHPTSGERTVPDEMMTVMDVVFRPIGRRPSPWNGSSEIVQITELLKQSNCFCLSDKTGISAEFPFGASTTLMRVITSENNPVIGSGVGIFLTLPIENSIKGASMLSGALNRLEANVKAPGHLIGSWCSRGDMTAFASFIPSAMHQTGVLLNLVISASVRARWVGELLKPGVEPADVIAMVAQRGQLLPSPE